MRNMPELYELKCKNCAHEQPSIVPLENLEEEPGHRCPKCNSFNWKETGNMIEAPYDNKK